MDLNDYIVQRLQSKKILVMTHLIVGYPSIDANWRMLEVMGKVDVDMVELQMPFSEPIADGPTFARANQLALAQGISLSEYFGFMQRAAETFAFPLLMMGYYNTAFRLGHESFCARLRSAGAEGFILPDLPFEEYGDLGEHSDSHDLTPVMLITPTNSPERLQQVADRSKGFIYTVARRGVTGSRTQLDAGLVDFIERCRGATQLPLALGFGLRNGDDLKHLQGRVEMAIVGSALLETWENAGEAGYEDLLNNLSEGRD